MVKKDCVLSDFTLAHELGHVMGAYHDSSTNTPATWAHGYNWRSPQGNFYGTLLGSKNGGRVRLNVFSAPKQRLCGYDEVIMGSESRADNTRVINTNRMALSMVGDESQACSYGGERNHA